MKVIRVSTCGGCPHRTRRGFCRATSPSRPVGIGNPPETCPLDEATDTVGVALMVLVTLLVVVVAWRVGGSQAGGGGPWTGYREVHGR